MATEVSENSKFVLSIKSIVAIIAPIDFMESINLLFSDTSVAIV